MKKHFAILFTLFFSLYCFAEDDGYNERAEMLNKIQELNGWYDFSDAGVRASISPDWIVVEGREYPLEEFRFDKNGFYYLKDNIVIFDDLHHLMSWHNTTLDFHPIAYEEIPYGNDGGYKPSSFITENLNGEEIGFDTSKLNFIISLPYRRAPYLWGSSYSNFFIWNDEHKPWGIKKTGESVMVELEQEANSFALLNGYVNPFHPEYYKNNARIKDIKITDGNGKEYFFTLADEVRIQTFWLDDYTKNITLTVLSTYDGEKSDDIFLSLFAGTYAPISWFLRSRRFEKENAETAYSHKSNETPLEHLLIFEEWEMYALAVATRIQKEFDGKKGDHDIEIYTSSDLKIHLTAHDGNTFIKFFSKEKIKKIGYEFKNFYVNYELPFEYSSRFQTKPYSVKKKDDWIITEFEFIGGSSEQLILPLSAKFTMQFKGGRMQYITISKDGLNNMKRFGELVLGAFDLKLH